MELLGKIGVSDPFELASPGQRPYQWSDVKVSRVVWDHCTPGSRASLSSHGCRVFGDMPMPNPSIIASTDPVVIEPIFVSAVPAPVQADLPITVESDDDDDQEVDTDLYTP